MIQLSERYALNTRKYVLNVYPFGDQHIGARTCAEKLIRKQVCDIKADAGSRWFGGGDMLEAIKPQDVKRWDMDVIPDWMLEGDAKTIRKRLNDMLQQQINRAAEIFSPIREQCIGLIEGNHEGAIRRLYNHDVHQQLCDILGVPNLTDEFCCRMIFSRNGGTRRVVKMYACHGHGGGRTAGSEPNHLYRMLSEWEDFDICFRGHSHTSHILPPKAVLRMKTAGPLRPELHQHYRMAANWGCWLYSHSIGPGTYASRACYPARPMVTCKAVIRPFMPCGGIDMCHKEIRAITL